MQANSNTPPGFSYHGYLATREWALLKRQLRLRSHGVCENCHRRPYEETHHVTYERLGHEELTDLMAVCRLCHEYFSAIIDVNPAAICCTPEQAQDWLDGLIEDEEPEEVIEAAERHLREITAILG